MTRAVIKKVLILVFFVCFACKVACFDSFADSVATDEQVLEELSQIAADVSGGAEGAALSIIADKAPDDLGGALLSAIEPSRLVSDVLSYAMAALPDALALLCTLASLVLISALCTSVAGGVAGGALSGGLELCATAAMISAIAFGGHRSFEMVSDYFEDLARLVEAMIPVAGTVWAMGGNVSTASVGTAGLYTLLAVVERICAVSVMPVCLVMGITAACSALSGGTLLCGFGSAIKKTYNFFIGALMTVLVFALGAQTAVASAADGVSTRGAKLITATVIPVVGGAVGDTLRTVAGSVQYVKSVVGIGGIVFIAYMTIPVFVSVLLCRTAVLLCASMAQMLGCSREARLLDELGGVYGCLLGAVSISAIAFCVAFAIFVKCTVAAA